MKRTHDAMQSESKGVEEANTFVIKPYIDPVNHEPVSEAFMLPACGHTFDKSTIDSLASASQGVYSYTCPLCRCVSQGFKRNYAVEEMMGIANNAALIYSPTQPASEETTLPIHRRYDTEIRTALRQQEIKREAHILECDSHVHLHLLRHIEEVHSTSFYAIEEPKPIRKALFIEPKSVACFDSYVKFMMWLTIPHNGLLYSKRLSNIQIDIDATLTDSKYNEIEFFDYHKWRKKWSEIYIKISYMTHQERAMLASLHREQSDESSSSNSD